MSSENQPGGVSRREFVTTASGAAVGACVAGDADGRGAPGKRRYAIVGTGVRGDRHVGTADRAATTATPSSSSACATSTRCALEAAKKQMGVACPTFTNFDEMLDKAKPDLLMVTTVDATHSEFIVKALEPRHRRDDREADGHRRDAVPGGARRREAQPARSHRHVQLPLRAEASEDQGTADGRRDRQDHVGRFLLVPRHVARRRLLPPLAPAAQAKSGSLWVHKATHHFDLDQLVARRRSGGGLGARQRWRTTARAARSATPTAGRARTRTSARTTGTSRGSRELVELYVDCRDRRTATCATAASSRKTSTSSTR